MSNGGPDVRVLIAGGGTGGHVYPAIAIAQAIRRQRPGAAIRFAGTRNHIEWSAVPEAGFEIAPVSARGLQRGSLTNTLAIPFSLLRGFWQSMRIIQRFKPDVALGTGGYVSAPVLWMASRLRVPVVIQEQNAFPGKTNKMLASGARRIHIAFEGAASYFPDGRCVVSGNPTRPEFAAITREAARRTLDLSPDAKVLFVTGGSGGSLAMNEAMASVADELKQRGTLNVLWQTGRRYYEKYRHLADDGTGARNGFRILPFVDDMPAAFAAADVALCRSGAITCSELAVTGTPAILVPSPNVAGDHQTFNARAVEAAGGAVIIPESELQAKLLDVVDELLGDGSRLQEMSERLKAHAKPDAAEEIADDVLRVAAEGRA